MDEQREGSCMSRGFIVEIGVFLIEMRVLLCGVLGWATLKRSPFLGFEDSLFYYFGGKERARKEEA